MNKEEYFKLFDNLSIDNLQNQRKNSNYKLNNRRYKFIRQFSNNSLEICSNEIEIQLNLSSLKICTICLEEIEFENKHYLHCGHVFHCNCINKWLKNSYICPNCKQNSEGNCFVSNSSNYSFENNENRNRNGNGFNGINEINNLIDDIILIGLVSGCLLISIMKVFIFKNNFG